MPKGLYTDRDELCDWGVSIWSDACRWKQTQEQVLKALARLRTDPSYIRLPMYQRQYIEGYLEAFRKTVIERTKQEHGYWVRMPDGTEQWFGLAERLQQSTVELERETGIGLTAGSIGQYIYENKIPERSGIYWLPDPRTGNKPGEKPYSIPALRKASAGS